MLRGHAPRSSYSRLLVGLQDLPDMSNLECACPLHGAPTSAAQPSIGEQHEDRCTKAAGVHSAETPFSQAETTEFQVILEIALARRLPSTMDSSEHIGRSSNQSRRERSLWDLSGLIVRTSCMASSHWAARAMLRKAALKLTKPGARSRRLRLQGGASAAFTAT